MLTRTHALLVLLSASCMCVPLTPGQANILQTMHKGMGKYVPLASFEETKARVEQIMDAIEDEGAERHAEVQTQIELGCENSLNHCNAYIFANATSAWLEIKWKNDCANRTCECAQDTAFRCNETCYATSKTSGDLEYCLGHECTLERQQPAGSQLAEIFMYGEDEKQIDLTDHSVTVININGSHPAGEGPENLIDGDIATKWFDANRGDLYINFSQPLRVSSMQLVTANDFPDRDPSQFVIKFLDPTSGKYETVASINDNAFAKNDTAGFVPLARGAATQHINTTNCMNLYDVQNGEGACASAMAQNNLTCAKDMCPTCRWHGYCDALCNFVHCDVPVTSIYIHISTLRNPGKCKGELLDRNDWWSREAAYVRDTCGVPWLAPDNWYCYSNRGGEVDCPASKDACQINQFQTTWDTTTKVYTDRFENEPCNQIEDCDDSMKCHLESYQDYLKVFPESVPPAALPVCQQLWNCIGGRFDQFMDNCTENHVTYDQWYKKCDQKKICAHLKEVQETIVHGPVSCQAEHEDLIVKDGLAQLQIDVDCTERTCAQLGLGTIGKCGKYGGYDCCINGTSISAATSGPKLNWTVDGHSEIHNRVVQTTMTCEQFEYYHNYKGLVCPYVDGPNLYKEDAHCKDWSWNILWDQARLGSMQKCMSYGPLWVDAFNKTCFFERVCDPASARIARCDTKPIGVQECSDPRLPLEPYINMTMDAAGYCRCPETHDCQPESGYCKMKWNYTYPPSTLIPQPVDTLAPTDTPSPIVTWDTPTPMIYLTETPETTAPDAAATPVPGAATTPTPAVTPVPNTPVTATPGAVSTPAPAVSTPVPAVTTPTPGTVVTPAPGTASTPAPGTVATPAPGTAVTPTPGTASTPVPAVTTPTPGTASTPAPGTVATPAPGTAVTPTPGTASTPVPAVTTPTPGTASTPAPGTVA
eukprot:Rhum_TRINITY_DN12371_c0_g1::Rhum_TRINITY_DN12371_c0_g1_i1::g.51393::m.51393